MYKDNFSVCILNTKFVCLNLYWFFLIECRMYNVQRQFLEYVFLKQSLFVWTYSVF